jgi:PAS domain S-box-containing protein
LANAKTTLQAAFEQSPIPMVLVSMPDAVLRIVNTACRNFLGIMDEPSPIGQPLASFIPSYQEYDADGNLISILETPLALALQGHSTLSQERKIVTKTGAQHWALVSGNPIYNNNGDLIAAYLVFPDITERRKAEDEKVKLEIQLLQTQKMESVGSLAGGVAHDFNNKLSVILGCTYLVSTEEDPAKRHHYLEEIRNAGEQSADLTRQLLAFARKQTIVPQVLDLNKTVGGMLKMLGRLIGEDIRLAWQPDSDLWLVKFDPSQMDQILANLCVNARDSISDGGMITIGIGNVTIDDDFCTQYSYAKLGEYVRLTVSDNGCGMNIETQIRIFEPFFTTKEVGKGTGLGLSTVFGIVKQNNGFINVESELDVGTTFKIYLPKYSGPIEQPQNAEIKNSAPRGLENVLLVEDELAILTMVKAMLTKQGYTVLTASTPSEAINLAKVFESNISLLITDVIMPEMNGNELANNIKAFRPQIKSLFMSGYTADAISKHGVLDEGINFIQKPFSLPDLATRVREVLDA